MRALRQITILFPAFFLYYFPHIVFAQIYIPTSAETGLSSDTPSAIIESALNIILAFLGVLAILVIVLAGIIYMTSEGDDTRTDTAKQWLTYAIIGLIVALLGWIIVKTVGGALGANF